MQNNLNFSNEIVVEIDGKQHKHWKSYSIDSDFLIPADAFSFDVGVSSENTVLPDFTGKNAVVKINGETVLTGIIDSTRHSILKGQRSFSLNGRDRASLLIDCSAPVTNVKGLTVLEAVKKIVAPLGITQVELKAESNPKLDKVDIEIGETTWSAITRCANSAGLHCWFDPRGVLIVGGADYSQPTVAELYSLKNGQLSDMSSIELMRDISQRYSEVVFLGQRHGRENDSNKNDLKWVYKDSAVDFYKSKTVVIADVENLEALKKHAKKFISDSMLASFNLRLIVPDHKTKKGVLWQPGQRVQVYIEEYGIDEIFFIMGRRFTLSRNGGTQTELRLKPDGIWTPDAYKRKRHVKEKARKLIALGAD
ncbi:phage tail protein [Mergibacter septicus]|uniref:phage baseplate assembly protein n=1 Tax=Mergibacter septicus TaxID=221402 RepID=UPI001178D8D4|nr:phage tail protein [Mergibacter septicus]AWX14647.1 phage tail protein [Mergibacter septicus]